MHHVFSSSSVADKRAKENVFQMSSIYFVVQFLGYYEEAKKK
jgi:hypothetical protein